MKRTGLSLLALVAGLLALLAPTTALAGGWAVVVLDTTPTTVVAGEPLTVGFRVLQHGQTPIARQNPLLMAWRVDSTEWVSDVARDEGAEGHYVARLVFPTPGTWTWSVNTFGADHRMPPITVVAPASATATAAPPAPTPTTAPAVPTAAPTARVEAGAGIPTAAPTVASVAAAAIPIAPSALTWSWALLPGSVLALLALAAIVRGLR